MIGFTILWIRHLAITLLLTLAGSWVGWHLIALLTHTAINVPTQQSTVTHKQC